MALWHGIVVPDLDRATATVSPPPNDDDGPFTEFVHGRGKEETGGCGSSGFVLSGRGSVEGDLPGGGSGWRRGHGHGGAAQTGLTLGLDGLASGLVDFFLIFLFVNGSGQL